MSTRSYTQILTGWTIAIAGLGLIPPLQGCGRYEIGAVVTLPSHDEPLTFKGTPWVLHLDVKCGATLEDCPLVEVRKGDRTVAGVWFSNMVALGGGWYRVYFFESDFDPERLKTPGLMTLDVNGKPTGRHIVVAGALAELMPEARMNRAAQEASKREAEDVAKARLQQEEAEALAKRQEAESERRKACEELDAATVAASTERISMLVAQCPTRAEEAEARIVCERTWRDASSKSPPLEAIQVTRRTKSAFSIADPVALRGELGRRCAVTSRGEALCWGPPHNPQYEYGSSMSGDDEAVPTPIGESEVADLFVGYEWGQDHSDYRQFFLVLTRKGGLRCWSSSESDCLEKAEKGCQCPESSGSTFVNMPGLESNISQFDVGHGFACALTWTGEVLCWGKNERGQLGDGTTTSRQQPAPVMGLPQLATAVSVGWSSACAVLVNGSVA